MRILDTYRDSTCRRLISEAIHIEEAIRKRDKGAKTTILNSMKQWFQPEVIRVRASPGINYTDD